MRKFVKTYMTGTVQGASANDRIVSSRANGHVRAVEADRNNLAELVARAFA